MTLPILGFLAGLLIGATGVGAGSIMAPALLLVVGLPAAEVVGVALAYSSVTKFVSTIGHVWNRNVDWRVVGWLALGSLPTAIIVVMIDRMWLAGAGSGETQWLETAIGILLVVVGLWSLMTTWIGLRWATARRETAAGAQRAAIAAPYDGALTASQAWTLAAGGVFIGVVTSLTSIGVGALTAPLLLVAEHLGPRRALVANIVHGFFLTAVAGGLYMVMGFVHVGVVAWILTGSIPGVLLGGALARKIPSRALGGLVAAAVTIAGVLVLV